MFRILIAMAAIAAALFMAAQLEPNREGIIHDSVRGRTIIKSNKLPKIQIKSPLKEWKGSFIVEIQEFDYRPDLATNPVAAFASGYQEANRGHIHGWVFNSNGEQIRFYGAAQSIYEKPFYVKPDKFPPGEYTVFFQLQNHDHTPIIPVAAPQFPAIASAQFTVTDEESGAGVVNVPNCGCGDQVCLRQ